MHKVERIEGFLVDPDSTVLIVGVEIHDKIEVEYLYVHPSAPDVVTLEGTGGSLKVDIKEYRKYTPVDYRGNIILCRST